MSFPYYAHADVFSPITSELERIAGVLKECDEASKIKKIFKRADILSKIQHCDGRLTHALSMLQVCLEASLLPAA